MTKFSRNFGCTLAVSTLTNSKPGPKSYKDKSTKVRGGGLVTRRETRKWENMSAASCRAVRTGWNTAWRYAGPYMRRKRIPTVFRKTNIHGGLLWANRSECKMTDKMAGEIIERVYLSKKVALSQLRQVRHSLSYSYYLKKGISKDNWPEVKAQWDGFALASLPGPKQSLKAVRIPVPENHKEAWTKPWTHAHPMPLALFEVAAIGAHDYFIYGLRPRVDIMKVKTSITHVINTNEKFGATEMVCGRSKLHGNKRGTRPWNVFRVCFCRGGRHTPVPKNIRLDNQGNPTGPVMWNTVCPLAIMEFLRNIQDTSTFKLYPKWRQKAKIFGKMNHGDIPELANKWLQSQTQQDPFDPNAGRKSLSRWLNHLNVNYEEGHEIHGDLQCVWRASYQSTLPKSSYEVRDQSKDSDKATKALRKFAKWLYEDEVKTSIKEQLQGILANMD